ncbi:hypothetical protein E6C67_14180 [Azospirillum sp. TSA2s]|uniref:hypothetical protein n=1 Tax=Azospirillum sp. TSA2s TaxID=709810 RepID=UPI0010AA8BA9|nr:hypothetical protein [Azospirillum sp. TSA2s]QCG94977.1 hypothetical protein E6C67_14180 [Azospirillum sp. TSA2s]
MANQFAYDHPTYAARQFQQGVAAVGAGTATPAADLYAPHAANLWNAHFYVTTAGTATAAAFRVINVSGTTTTTIGSVTAGTSAAGSAVRLNALSTASTITPTALAADSRTYAITVSDATLAGRVVWELALDKGGLAT